MRPTRHLLPFLNKRCWKIWGYQAISGDTLRHKMDIDIMALNVDFDVTDSLTLSSYTQVRDMERIRRPGPGRQPL